jgi:ketosteroid isomerase-like protein
MRNLTATYAVFGSLFLVSMAAGAAPGAAADDTAKLTALGCEMGHAYARQDPATLDKLDADDYTQTDTRGVVVSHDEYPAYVRERTAATFRNGESTLTIECDSIEVRLYGEAAVVTGGWTYIVKKPDGDLVRHSRWTSMWTRYAAGWKRHAFQNTWINPDANRPAPCVNSSRVTEAPTPDLQVNKR